MDEELRIERRQGKRVKRVGDFKAAVGRVCVTGSVAAGGVFGHELGQHSVDPGTLAIEGAVTLALLTFGAHELRKAGIDQAVGEHIARPRPEND